MYLSKLWKYLSKLELEMQQRCEIGDDVCQKVTTTFERESDFDTNSRKLSISILILEIKAFQF